MPETRPGRRQVECAASRRGRRSACGTSPVPLTLVLSPLERRGPHRRQVVLAASCRDRPSCEHCHRLSHLHEDGRGFGRERLGPGRANWHPARFSASGQAKPVGTPSPADGSSSAPDHDRQPHKAVLRPGQHHAHDHTAKRQPTSSCDEQRAGPSLDESHRASRISTRSPPEGQRGSRSAQSAPTTGLDGLLQSSTTLLAYSPARLGRCCRVKRPGLGQRSDERNRSSASRAPWDVDHLHIHFHSRLSTYTRPTPISRPFDPPSR